MIQLINGNPPAAAVMAMIKKLVSVLHLAEHETNLSMVEIAVSQNGICGTTLCHGGWYALACRLKETKFDDVSYLGWTDGANHMAENLGFTQERYRGDPFFVLARWARDNHAIWGNDDGQSMFNNPMAFKSLTRPFGALKLLDIGTRFTTALLPFNRRNTPTLQRSLPCCQFLKLRTK